MGALPSSNLSIGAISQELVNGSKSLRTLSADAGKSTPDSMSEFRGYQLGTAAVSMQEDGGSYYDGCSFSVDHFCGFQSTDPNFGSIGLYSSTYGQTFTYNSEPGPTKDNGGTFLTFGGYSSATVHGRYGVTAYSWANTDYRNPCQPMYVYINLNSSRVANAMVGAVYNLLITYSLTASPGGTYNFNAGIGYGTV